MKKNIKILILNSIKTVIFLLIILIYLVQFRRSDKTLFWEHNKAIIASVFTAEFCDFYLVIIMFLCNVKVVQL